MPIWPRRNQLVPPVLVCNPHTSGTGPMFITSCGGLVNAGSSTVLALTRRLGFLANFAGSSWRTSRIKLLTDRKHAKPATEAHFRIIDFHARFLGFHRIRHSETCFRKPAKCGPAGFGKESGGTLSPRFPRATSPDGAQPARNYRGTKEGLAVKRLDPRGFSSSPVGARTGAGRRHSPFRADG